MSVRLLCLSSSVCTSKILIIDKKYYDSYNVNIYISKLNVSLAGAEDSLPKLTGLNEQDSEQDPESLFIKGLENLLIRKTTEGVGLKAFF
jgi:hypothetical protein